MRQQGNSSKRPSTIRSLESPRSVSPEGGFRWSLAQRRSAINLWSSGSSHGPLRFKQLNVPSSRLVLQKLKSNIHLWPLLFKLATDYSLEWKQFYLIELILLSARRALCIEIAQTVWCKSFSLKSQSKFLPAQFLHVMDLYVSQMEKSLSYFVSFNFVWRYTLANFWAFLTKAWRS